MLGRFRPITTPEDIILLNIHCASVHDSHIDNVLKIAEGQENDELIVTRHSQFDPPINIINVYGRDLQESKIYVIKTPFGAFFLDT